MPVLSELGASAGTLYLSIKGSAAVPYLAIPYAGYYMSMELLEAKIDEMEAQRGVWLNQDAIRRLNLYRDIRKTLME